MFLREFTNPSNFWVEFNKFEFRGVFLLDWLLYQGKRDKSAQLPTSGERIVGRIPFSRVLVLSEMQTASTWIWIRVTQFISNDDNHTYIYMPLIGLVGRVFDNALEDLGSIPDHVIPKTLKMLLDISLLDTQQYKVRIKRKVEKSRERRSAFPYISV